MHFTAGIRKRTLEMNWIDGAISAMGRRSWLKTVKATKATDGVRRFSDEESTNHEKHEIAT